MNPKPIVCAMRECNAKPLPNNSLCKPHLKEAKKDPFSPVQKRKKLKTLAGN
jgi:hypothetical protein